jgi:EAL domain-containing protein (putative c-di-GMP-specific phosphodiesterase class I)
VEGKCFKHFKIPAAQLLSYTDREGERAADLLLPRIERRKHTLVVSHVEKSHQLSSLIDLDVSTAQGNIISPPREIRPYADVPAASGDN